MRGFFVIDRIVPYRAERNLDIVNLVYYNIVN